MQLLDLNVDVLLYIASFQVRREVSYLARTCRFLHDTLAPAILKGIVTLTYLRLASFSQFMHLDSTGRRFGRDLFPFLRILRLSLLPDYRCPMSLSDLVSAVTDLLKHCRHLVSLELYYASITFTPAQLQLALSTPLPDLRTITLQSITIDYRDVLAGVASPLRTVNLTMSRRTGEDTSDSFADPDPLPFLQYHRSTLTTLTLTPVSLGDFGAPFPSVRRLTIFGFSLTNDETGWVGPLVWLFPGVEHVELWSLYARDGSSPTRNLDPRDETALRIAGTWRTRAKVWQAQHGTWANGLRFLRVHSMMDLYCLGLSCHIERLDVRNLSPSGTITTGALADPRPCRLWFQIWSESDMDGAVPMLFRTVARTSSLTHLMIDLGDDLLQYSDPGKLLVQIAGLLRNTIVSHLALYIATDRFSREQLFGAVGPVPSSGAPEALRIYAQDNSALRRMFVGYDFDSNDVRAWEAHRTTGEPIASWTEVGQSRVRELMSSEGLTRYDH
ncbi:hypothetical protein VTO73DRAFT_8346 [Trametes versicolor]